MHIDTASRGARWTGFGLFVLAASLLVLNALTAKLNHDESQYVAGSMLAGRGLGIFQAFMSLQPPLQTWAYAPLGVLFYSDAFIAMRLFSAALALMTLALVHRAQRKLGVARSVAVASTVLMSCCGAFLMTSAVVRNDMLAAVLVSGGLVAILPVCGQKERAFRWIIGGLCFGLALSTKLSFAPYGLAGGVFILMSPRHLIAGRLRCYGAGALLGIGPLVFCAISAPSSMLWGIITYATIAPFDHYTAIGLAGRLGTEGKLFDLARFALQGPLLAAAIMVGLTTARGRLALDTPPRRLLILLLLAGIVGAALPTPTQKQYLLPILPPLFVLLGATLSSPSIGENNRTVAATILAIFAIVGLAKPIRTLTGMRHGTASALQVDNRAAWIGMELRRAGDSGAVATLSPEQVAGSGFEIDRHFATGPFVLRSGHLLNDKEALAFNVATTTTLDAVLRAKPPAGLLSGYETITGDRALAGWAIRHGYRALPVPDGVGTLYVCAGELEPGRGCRAT